MKSTRTMIVNRNRRTTSTACIISLINIYKTLQWVTHRRTWRTMVGPARETKASDKGELSQPRVRAPAVLVVGARQPQYLLANPGRRAGQKGIVLLSWICIMQLYWDGGMGRALSVYRVPSRGWRVCEWTTIRRWRGRRRGSYPKAIVCGYRTQNLLPLHASGLRVYTYHDDAVSSFNIQHICVALGRPCCSRSSSLSPPSFHQYPSDLPGSFLNSYPSIHVRTYLSHVSHTYTIQCNRCSISSCRYFIGRSVIVPRSIPPST